jgi:hypothetical protein
VVEFANVVASDLSVTNVLQRYFPSIVEWPHSAQVFRSYFANVHCDYAERCRAQFMVVLANPYGHRLYSVGPGGQENILVPDAGDIVFLDTRRPHAILPVTGGVPSLISGKIPWNAFS